MILYTTSIFGFRSLLRVHGSPVYKVLFPTMCSTGFLLFFNWCRHDSGYHIFRDTYTVGAFIVFFSFLLTFRLNHAYARYWEAATAVHNMISKWVDVGMMLAAFHYQAKPFEAVRPPAFGSHPTILAADLQRRTNNNSDSMEQTILRIQSFRSPQPPQKNAVLRYCCPNKIPNVTKPQQNDCHFHIDNCTKRKVVAKSINKGKNQSGRKNTRIPIPMRFQERFQRAAQTAKPTSMTNLRESERDLSILQAQHVQMPPPSLFLQELAHLVSLLSAVAMSTLRNDIEGCPPALVEYFPGKPWPPVDPDDDPKHEKQKYGGDRKLRQALYFMFGVTRSERNRTLYNAARPFSVLGGVSDDEMRQLERARGPVAQSALCFMWLQEFIIRESLLGSVGEINPSIVSRCFHCASDGSFWYSQARKIAYAPFPFPHGQMSAIFSLTIIFIFPMLFQEYVNKLWFACVLNTVTVLCHLGIHEVARELENPFTNMPNDLPLSTFQAQVNESLVTMYAGYHPDAWWTIIPKNEDPAQAASAEPQ